MTYSVLTNVRGMTAEAKDKRIVKLIMGGRIADILSLNKTKLGDKYRVNNYPSIQISLLEVEKYGMPVPVLKASGS